MATPKYIGRRAQRDSKAQETGRPAQCFIQIGTPSITNPSAATLRCLGTQTAEDRGDTAACRQAEIKCGPVSIHWQRTDIYS